MDAIGDRRRAGPRGRQGRKVAALLLGLSLGVLGPPLRAQTAADTAAIRGVVQDEITAWDQGDAAAYSRHVADDATFTNIRGQFFTGKAGFQRQHAAIFAGIFKHTTLRQDIVSLRFVGADVAVVEVLTAVTGVTQRRPGMTFDAHGRLRTRLLQVLTRRTGEWTIVAYHNVDIKPGVPIPEPR
ncbi:MAG TPA: SgcJ/EcaC family oxidoreductase [Gemmatimonadales bacterium]|nr:SgcJ/EcaC family oxidoreductase [Gemmatimonadales bacterium]